MDAAPALPAPQQRDPHAPAHELVRSNLSAWRARLRTPAANDVVVSGHVANPRTSQAFGWSSGQTGRTRT